MTTTFRFRNFQVYIDTRLFLRVVKQLTQQKFPDSERFGLRSQLWRALDSILLNIAEGADRGTDKDFAHFLNLAHTSLNEVVACFDIALDCAYLDSNAHAELLEQAALIGDQLTAFRNKLLTTVYSKTERRQRSVVSGTSPSGEVVSSQ